MTDIPLLLAVLVRTARATRVLEIGTGNGDRALALAEALPPAGMLITIERNPTVAAAAREVFTNTAYRDRISVVIGDASRYLHKVAGPFDVIVQTAGAGLTLHDRVVALLAPRALLVTRNAEHAPSYNESLRADRRLQTITLAVEPSVAGPQRSVSLSVRHDHHDA